jgi:hypothetical protein
MFAFALCARHARMGGRIVGSDADRTRIGSTTATASVLKRVAVATRAARRVSANPSGARRLLDCALHKRV